MARGLRIPNHHCIIYDFIWLDIVCIRRTWVTDECLITIYLCTSDHTAMIDCHDHITHSFLEQCMAIWWPTEETGTVCKSMNEWMECYTSPIILHPIETFNHPIIVLIYGQIDCEIIELLAEIFLRFGLGLVPRQCRILWNIVLVYCMLYSS